MASTAEGASALAAAISPRAALLPTWSRECAACSTTSLRGGEAAGRGGKCERGVMRSACSMRHRHPGDGQGRACGIKCRLLARSGSWGCGWLHSAGGGRSKLCTGRLGGPQQLASRVAAS